MALSKSDAVKLAQAVAAQFAEIPEVEAVALGGSLAAGQADALSDIDLYVFAKSEIPVATRAALIEPRAAQMQLDNRFWELEDYWRERDSGIKIEAIYRDPEWLSGHLQDLLKGKGAQLGYSTSLWHSIVVSKNLFDRDRWFAELQKSVDVPYPDVLAQAVIAKNFPLLRGSMADIPSQLEVTVEREDWVGVHHRIDLLLGCYFDTLFALNRALHPGGKRQLAYAEKLDLKPENMTEDVNGLAVGLEPKSIVAKVDELVDQLERLLSEQGQLPEG